MFETIQKYVDNVYEKSVGDEVVIVHGTVSTPRRDSHGEELLFSYKSFQKAWDEFQVANSDNYLQNNGTIINHRKGTKIGTQLKFQNRVIGRVLHIDYTPKVDMNFDNYDELFDTVKLMGVVAVTDPEVIKAVKDGVFKGFSLSWKINKGKKDIINSKKIIIEDFSIRELSLVEDPANYDSKDMQLAPESELEDILREYNFEGELATVQNIYKDKMGGYFLDIKFHRNNMYNLGLMPLSYAKSLSEGLYAKKIHDDYIFKIASFADYPSCAITAAKKIKRWKEKYGSDVRGITLTSSSIVNQLANGEPLSKKTIQKIAQGSKYVNSYTKITSQSLPEPWKIPTVVAVYGLGGLAMIQYSNRMLEASGDMQK
jgi:hypothetical protein